MFGKKKKIEELNKKIVVLESENEKYKVIVSDKQLNVKNLMETGKKKKQELIKIEKAHRDEIEKYKQMINHEKETLESLKKQVVDNEEKINLQELGEYDLIFKYQTSEEYKDKISDLRDEGKWMLKNKTYYKIKSIFTYNNSIPKGKKLQNKMAKEFITAFNLNANSVIERVSIRNYQKTKEKMQKIYNNIDKELDNFGVGLVPEYLEIKFQILELMYELVQKKEEEKEEKRQQKEMIKEQKKVEKELEKEKEKLKKELEHYNNQLKKGDQTALEKIEEINEKIKNNDYRIGHSLAGYVYIIENKSFMDSVYKIGVTRRLDPLDRISELSNASVPFKFQANCIVFSDNAYKLEKEMHTKFADKRVNKVKKHKEYYKVTLDEIKEALQELQDREFEIIPNPANDEWEISQAIEYKNKKNSEKVQEDNFNISGDEKITLPEVIDIQLNDNSMIFNCPLCNKEIKMEETELFSEDSNLSEKRCSFCNHEFNFSDQVIEDLIDWHYDE